MALTETLRSYVYFEKIRIATGKKKTPKRINNEEAQSGGLPLSDRRRVRVWSPACVRGARVFEKFEVRDASILSLKGGLPKVMKTLSTLQTRNLRVYSNILAWHDIPAFATVTQLCFCPRGPTKHAFLACKTGGRHDLAMLISVPLALVPHLHTIGPN
jgi:hypothetical protein